MPDLMPVNQIATVEDRQAREIFKGRGDQIIVVTHSTNGRVRIKTWQDRIAKRPGHFGILSFQSASCKPRDDLSLGEKIKDDDGDHGQSHKSQNQCPVLNVLWVD
jgi:hypothetical protein